MSRDHSLRGLVWTYAFPLVFFSIGIVVAQDIRRDDPPPGVVAKPSRPLPGQVRPDDPPAGVIAQPQSTTPESQGPRTWPHSLWKKLQETQAEIARIDPPWREYAQQQWSVCAEI